MTQITTPLQSPDGLPDQATPGAADAHAGQQQNALRADKSRHSVPPSGEDRASAGVDVAPSAASLKESSVDRTGVAQVARQNKAHDKRKAVQETEARPPAASAKHGYEFADVVSGQFDADEESPELPPAKRVLQPQVETPKLHKVLAQAGMGSRLEMEQLILEGRISVNNEPAHVGQRIQYGDQIKVNGKPIRYRIDPPPARVIAYHKPVGEVVTHDDPQNRPTVFRKLPRQVQGKWQSVGRLDLNTEGLLLFTSSGELANKLMHPRFGLEREYAVRVLGALSNEEKTRLLDGVQLDDGVASFGSIEDGGGEGANCWYRITISEGRNREVRRMLEAVGHAVSRLIRIRYGAMVLPRGLKRGAWMELDERDIQALLKAAGAERTAKTEARNELPLRTNGRAVLGRSRQAGPAGRSGGAFAERGARPPARDDKNRAANVRVPGNAQPDPLKTSVGYIGADSLSRQRQEQRKGSKGMPGGRGGAKGRGSSNR